METSGSEKKLEKPAPSQGILDIGVAVFLLTLLALLVANVYIMCLAKDYNEKACREATREAALAALSGKDVNVMMRAAQDGLNRTGQGGFFIQQPNFTEFLDHKVHGVRQLRVETQTEARLLAPVLLLFDLDASQRGNLVFKSTCIVEFRGQKF